MKKLLIFLLPLISFIFFSNVSSASAKTVQAYYDSDYVNNQILGKTDLDYLNNQLIPFINNNMQNYYVYIGLNNGNNANYTTAYIIILDKNNYDYSGIRMYNRSGYSNYLRFSRYNTIDDNFNITDVGAGYMQFTYRTDTNLSTTSSYDTGLDIIQALQNWLNSPSYNYPTNYDSNISTLVYQTGGNLNFLDQVRTPSERLPYFINYNSLLVTSTDYSSYQGDYVIHYNNEEYIFNLGSTFPTYYGFVNNFILPKPIVKKFGSNQYGINSYNINYYSSGFTNLRVSCPTTRDFTENGFCNIFGSDYDDLTTLSNSYYDVEFPFLSSNNVSIPIKNNHYYIFTFRYDSYYSLTPTRLSYFDHLYNANQNVDIVDFNIIDKGVYKDMQLVFMSDLFGENDSSIDYITITFDNLGDYDVDIDLFKYGVYKSYKLTDFGTQLPNFNDLSNDYSKNDIDVVSNGGNSSSNFFTNFTLSNHGLGGIITSPLRIYTAMKTTNTCTPLTIPFPNTNNSITIPCIREVISSNLGALFVILQTILSGIICYRVSVQAFSTVKNMQDPKTDSIEVIDL